MKLKEIRPTAVYILVNEANAEIVDQVSVDGAAAAKEHWRDVLGTHRPTLKIYIRVGGQD